MDPEMGQWERLARALLVETATAVAAMMLAVCKGKTCSASHANVGIDPLGRLHNDMSAKHSRGVEQVEGYAYSAAIYHAASNRSLWRELVAVSLQTLVDLPNIGQVMAPFCGHGPGLDKLENFAFHFGVYRDGANGLQQGHEVVHKLSRGYFFQKMISAILDASICQL
jgi:hypothetical protein